MMEGLSLHHRFLDEAEEARLVVWCESQLERRAELRGKTYLQSTVPKRALIENSGAAGSKWSRGKGRQVLQYGVFYDYAQHRIDPDQEVEPLPPVLLTLIELLVGEVLPASKRPDSAIINFYSPGDCIPPHIDHPSFERPFCALSLGSEANILFGKGIATVGPGEFAAPVSIALPQRSVVVFAGTAGNKVQHCIPAVAIRRISITFRRCPPNVRAKLGLK